MYKSIILGTLLMSLAYCQNKGTSTPEYHPPMPIQQCFEPGTCATLNTTIVGDSNWRWTHNVGGYVNCYSGNQWDPAYCPNSDACTANCAIDGIGVLDWKNPYGVSILTNGFSLQLVTHGQYGDNIGFRTFLLQGNQYMMFKLLNREFSFEVDVSKLPCGANGAVYFVEMDADGGMAKNPTNKAGAAYGTGYCDAQCPHDIKFIAGKANSNGWVPSSDDINSGAGLYGSCCAELDIWEANAFGQAFTAHPCSTTGPHACLGVECGDNSKNQRYQGVCDKDGCDLHTYRLNQKNFYGPGASYTLDSTKPFQLVTQFITSDGTDTGDLVEIRRHYVQNGKVIQTPKANVPGLDAFDSITDSNCKAQKKVFVEDDQFQAKGGLKAMGQAMKRGLVLVMSLWDDHEVNMLWLDSDYPLTRNRNEPGVQRGTCSTTSGKPSDIEKNYPDTAVIYKNFKIGVLGSTFTEEKSFLQD